jgi:SPP1 family predicted phage head-tail adaptor
MKDKRSSVGAMNIWATFQYSTVVRDGAGGQTKTWHELCQTYIALEDIAGSEFYSAHALNNEVTSKARTRYRSDITTDMRVVVGASVYEIVSPPIDATGQRRELVLMLKAVT